jgi:hypothetical protein
MTAILLLEMDQHQAPVRNFDEALAGI